MIAPFLLFKLAKPEVVESVGMLDVVLGFISLCCVGGITGLIDGRLYTNRHTAQQRSKEKRFLARTLLYSGSYLLLMVPVMLSVPSSAAKMIGSASGFLLVYLGPIASFRSIKRDAHGDIMTKAFGWSWKRAEKGYTWAIFAMTTIYGPMMPFILVQGKSIPIIVGIVGSCTVLIVLLWPRFWGHAHHELRTQTSFLTKIGMASYLSASCRLLILFPTVGSVMLVAHTIFVGWPDLPLEKVGIVFVSIVVVFTYVGILAALFSAIKPSAIESTAVPSQGITLTFRHAVVSSMLVFLIGTLLVSGPFFILSALENFKDIELAIIYTGVFGYAAMFVGLWYGAAVLRHLVLRFMLYRQGHIPKYFVRFLDYATNMIFLRKVGGGYVFIHRLVMEHFASLKNTPPRLSQAATIATDE